MSDNIKWGIRERMREGKVCLNFTRFLGYDKDETSKLIVVDAEVVIVRKIFELYLNWFGVLLRLIAFSKMKSMSVMYLCVRALPVASLLESAKRTGRVGYAPC